MSKLEEISAKVNQVANKIEELKQTKTPLEVFACIKQYAKEGYEAIPADEKSYFLKCFGIFDRESTPGQFMMRIRTSGGCLSLEQAQTLGELAKSYGNDYMDLTTRAAIELRYLEIENIPDLLARLEHVGLTSFQTGVDNIRSIIMDPLDGISEDSLLTCKPIVKEMEAVFLKNEEWIASLPRKFNTAITGALQNRCNVYGQDCGFVLAKKEGMLGFSPFLGGRVGHHSLPSNLFLTPNQVAPFYEALLKLFQTYGFRHNRNKNRFRFLLDEVGMDEIIREVQDQQGLTYPTDPEILTKEEGKIEFITTYKDQKHLHCPVPCGVFSGSALLKAVQFAQMQEAREIRLSVEQNFIVVGAQNLLLDDAFVKEYATFDNSYFRNIVACAGKKHCPFGIIEAKEEGLKVAQALLEKFPNHKEQLKFYWSCCPKGCGIHENGDFGFVGSKAKIDDEVVEVVSIYRKGELVKTKVPLHQIAQEIIAMLEAE
ncbi:hypothetical protein [Sulfurospirillum arsenophilum]|uniref:hypothetical protein n=1 Tax=Sulfurospirillum arsenophilum TaxID=56698 RepID=UPI0006933E11|nr:hypothetical protein [Sulfurospirillum arsenophilum]